MQQQTIQWAQWSQSVVEQMNEKTRLCLQSYGLDSQPYYWDLEAGEIVFDRGTDNVVADVTVIGTASSSNKKFIWSWANQDVPDKVKSEMEKIRDFGQKNDLEYLIEPKFDELPIDAMELLAVSGYILQSDGYFVDEIDGEIIYFSLNNFRVRG